MPENQVDQFVWAKRISTGETPQLTQAVIAEFIDSGLFARHLRRMRQIYRQKWELFQSLLERQLRGRIHIVAESAGMHLVLTGEFDDLALSQFLYTQGIGSTALSDHYIGSAMQSGLILGFANADEQQMRQCVRLLESQIG
jgi:GntR family transcriptional regulator/MocR family aminotransferase